MTVVDTSVVFAALAAWHPDHARASAALADRPQVVTHTIAELLATLTRLPGGLRVPGSQAVEAVRGLRLDAIPLPPDAYERVADLVAGGAVVGGAVYDALIAEGARAVRAPLLSLDARAVRTYAAVGVEHAFLGSEPR